MKRLSVALFILCVLLSCQKSDNEGRPGQIILNKCQDRTIGSEKLTICFKELIEDSRCPANAMCVWQGVAIAAFTVSDGAGTHQVTLGTETIPGMCSKDTIVAGYKVEFIDLAPYPGLPPTIPNQEITAQLKITKG